MSGSKIRRTNPASLLLSSTETIFYTMSIYFVAAKVTKTRYTLAGALLAFLYSFDEVALSSLLSTPRFITLPIRIMNYMELTFDPTLAAISTLLMLASLILIVLMERLVGLDMFMK